MNQNNIYSCIRKLAKSSDAQNLYSHAKELHLQLFKNIVSFTQVQLLYLRYLNFYSSLYLEIYLQEVDELVLKDEIYEEAYMLFREQKKNKTLDQDMDKKTPAQSKWVFKQPKAQRTF